MVEQGLHRTRLNDGKVDRRSRFIAGSINDQEELDICGLWRLDPYLSVTKIGSGIICINGPSWSPDDKVFYVTCTFKDIMWAYDYDIETGMISNRREFVFTKGLAGVCVGSTVDAEGCIWTAELVTSDVVRRTPDGMEERRIGMPVKNVTSVMFSGDELDEIYVTSMARIDHPGSERTIHLLRKLNHNLVQDLFLRSVGLVSKVYRGRGLAVNWFE